RRTQAGDALFMSLAALPSYLLIRRLGGGSWAALSAAALTVASADLFFASFVLADAVAYPLVLGAVYLGVCALARPSRGNQLGFALLAGLATFTRIQYVFLPLVFLAFWLWTKRGRPGARVVALLALGLIALAARVPLSGYTISDSKQDSPFLLAVFRLERAIGIGSGSLLVALVASGLACLAVAACFRPVFARWAVVATLV